MDLYTLVFVDNVVIYNVPNVIFRMMDFVGIVLLLWVIYSFIF